MRLWGLRVLVAQPDGGDGRAGALLEGQGATVVTCAHASAAAAVREGTFAALVIEGAEATVLSGLACCRGTLPIIVYAPGTEGSAAAEFYRDGADMVLMDGSPELLADTVEAKAKAGPARVESPESGASEPGAGDGGEPEIDQAAWQGLEDAVGPDAFGHLLSKVDGDIAGAHQRLKFAVPACDVVELREATHILMAVAGAVGAIGLQTLAGRLNRAAHDENAADIAAAGQEILREGERVLAYVRARYEV